MHRPVAIGRASRHRHRDDVGDDVVDETVTDFEGFTNLHGHEASAADSRVQQVGGRDDVPGFRYLEVSDAWITRY